LFARPELELSKIARAPSDGMVAFPDGAYVASFRPILNSQRAGEPRGIFLAARKFDESSAAHISDLTRTSVQVRRVKDPSLPQDYRIA
ncbi:CHASE4 domain-containing protein, partial [Vibrio parahaemolyticus]